MRRQLLASALLVLAATGCARTVGAAAPPQDGPPPLDAALVSGEFGWVLTPDALRISTDGGRTFRDTHPGIATGRARAAYFLDSQHGWVASAVGGTLTVAPTSDGGAHWTATRTPSGADTGDQLYASDPSGAWSPATVAFATPVDSAAVSPPRSGVVTARVERNGHTTTATLTSPDGGRTWSETATAAATAPAHRWDLTRVGKCARLKADCVLTTTLRATTDAGAHWTTLQTWHERLA